MIIAVTALKEKVRQKVFFIVSILGILILVFFSTGTGSISINGEEVTDYKVLAPILLNIINAICCVMAAVLSLNTIPNEYERKTSHLVLIRKVSQKQYHAWLTMANIMASLLAELILFAAFLIFMAAKNHWNTMWRLLPAFLLSAVGVVIVCVMASWLSIVLSKIFAGSICAAVVLAGIFYNELELLNSIVGGVGGKLLEGILYIVPNLHGIQGQAGEVISGSGADIHLLLTGLLWIYLFAIAISLFNRKEV